MLAVSVTVLQRGGAKFSQRNNLILQKMMWRKQGTEFQGLFETK